MKNNLDGCIPFDDSSGLDDDRWRSMAIAVGVDKGLGRR
jgi:hypothetical protein